MRLLVPVSALGLFHFTSRPVVPSMSQMTTSPPPLLFLLIRIVLMVEEYYVG